MPPANDTFPGSTLTGGHGSATGSNVGSTMQAGEPAPNEGDGTNTSSVWWTWTAPSSGDFIFDLSSSALADTTLEVFTGSAVGALTLVISDDDSGSGFKSKLTLTAVAGTTYRIRVMGYAAGDEGGITIAWHKNIPAPTITSRTPSSGKVGTNVVITGTNFTSVDSVTFAGVEAGFTVDSSTQITATVPDGATGINSPIDVGNDGGTAEYVGFTPLYPGPWIQPPDRWQGGWSVGGAGTLVVHGEHLVIPGPPNPDYVVVDDDELVNGSDSIDFTADLTFLSPYLPPGGSWPPDAWALDTLETPYGTALGPVKVELDSFNVDGYELIGPHRVSGTFDADADFGDSNVEITVDGAGIAYDQQFDGGAATYNSGTHYNEAFASYPAEELIGDIADGTVINVTGTATMVLALTAIDPTDPNAPHNLQWGLDASRGAHVSVWARPPRYRFLYTEPQVLGRPPLAHRQRRDGVATVGPPLAHLQGAVSGTRPDLAHRQQTP